MRWVNGDVPLADNEAIGQAEERNHERLETVSARCLEERLKAFSKDADQEALLSFVAVVAVLRGGEAEGWS